MTIQTILLTEEKRIVQKSIVGKSVLVTLIEDNGKDGFQEGGITLKFKGVSEIVKEIPLNKDTWEEHFKIPSGAFYIIYEMEKSKMGSCTLSVIFE